MRVRVFSLTIALVVVLICAWLAVGSAGAGATAAGRNRVVAVRVADGMLDRLVLPAGASRLSSVPRIGGNFLDGPFNRYVIASQVDEFRVWVVPDSPEEALALIRSHLPTGSKASFDTSGGTELQSSYSLRRVDPHSLGARQIVVAAVRESSHRTVVRVDAEVRYVAPHVNGQQVPASARVLQITVGSNLKHPTRTLTVFDTPEVRDLAEVVNNLPFEGNEQGVSYNCPAEGIDELTDLFVFKASPTGPALASVSELASEPTTDDPCSGAALTINGHQQPDLQDGGVLIKKASGLLHVSLTR